MLTKTRVGRSAVVSENTHAEVGINSKARVAVARKACQAPKAGNNTKIPEVNVAMPRKMRAARRGVTIGTTEAAGIADHFSPKIAAVRRMSHVRKIVNNRGV